MSKTKVLITGASGFIGGSIFSQLLKRPDFEVTALVRDKAKAAKLESIGAKVVLGSLDDFEILKNAAANSEVVIHTADAADHIESAKALIAGLKSRKSPKKGIYIHTSGTGVIFDAAKGQFASEKVYNDDVYADTHENIALDAFHRNVDLIVLEAGKSGEIDTFIVCPPTVYGIGIGPFNQDSIQLPLLIRSSIEQKKAVHVGQGLNIMSSVHVEDLADFYVLLLDKALAGEAPKNDDGYYFVENGEYVWKDLAVHVGKALVTLGVIIDATPTSWSENVPLFFELATGNNSRVKAVKARKLGWKPHHQSIFETVEETTSRIVNKQ